MIREQFPANFNLDKIRISVGGTMHKTLSTFSSHTGDMAFWGKVYKGINTSNPTPYDQFSDSDTGWLVHEVTHLVQQEKMGGLFNFLFPRYKSEYALGHTANYGTHYCPGAILFPRPGPDIFPTPQMT